MGFAEFTLHEYQ